MKLTLLILCIFYVKEAFTQIPLNNGEFILSHPKKGNWFQAYKDCRSSGQRLVKISDPEKLTRIQTLINELKVKSAIWTSINDLGREGYFYSWNDEITRITTNEWSFMKKHLNFSTETPMQSCLAISLNKKNNLNFQDMPCETTGFYLCERVSKNEQCEKYALEKFKDCNCGRVDDWEKMIANSLGLE